jgi:hypothetical protein
MGRGQMAVQLPEENPAGLSAFRQGAAAAWHGLVYLGRRPGLWRYVLMPFLVNLLLTGAVLAPFIVGVIAMLGVGLWWNGRALGAEQLGYPLGAFA